MYFKRIETEGLAHYSYIIGDESEMMIIDPRRDIEIYLDHARSKSMVIKGIFETHRNEDIVSGAAELSAATGAPVFISAFEELGHTYGTPIYEQNFPFGTMNIRSLHTSGHTRGHLSYVLEKEGKPYMLFCGDALFYGDVGRTDFYGESALEEMTGLLYDSIFEKILPLGDDVLLFPAHGSGSACGGEIEERDFSSIGFERKYNPALQVKNREAFVKKHAYMRPFPPYFKKVEVLNVEGAEFLGEKMAILPVTAMEAARFKGTIIDIRSRSAFAGGHLPGSLFLRYDIIASHLGYMVETDTPLLLFAGDLSRKKLSLAYMTLLRMGYRDVRGFVGSDAQRTLETNGVEIRSLEQISPKEYFAHIDDIFLLDVRKDDELSDDDPVGERLCVTLSTLATSLDAIPKGKKIIAVCKSGERATVAASYLNKMGFDAGIVRGGMLALKAQKM
ncbi:MAG: MBL fold metallo-hydrolase [Tissierellia bacterium]|nr:MBL fold metallo-hydrolase [Bacillota bacterium]NLL22681.1 MBL fold metallo-hydrolase [Tissierellia bacterium]